MPTRPTLPAGVEMSFRPATVQDLAFCFHIYVDGMRTYVEQLFGWDEADQQKKFVAVFRPEEARILCGRIGEAAAEVGWIQVEPEPDALHVKELHIAGGSRNLGLGAWTLTQMIDEARAEGKDVRLATYRISPALRFYQRLGFEVAAERGGVVQLRRTRLA